MALTFEGKYFAIMRKIFKRAALLVKLEVLEKSSKRNLKYIEKKISEPQSLEEVYINYIIVKKEIKSRKETAKNQM